MAGVKRRQQGLTLIETLVALAIMGLTTTAILVLVGQNTRFAAQASDRAYASIAVDNLMVEALAISGPIDDVDVEGAVVVADRQWRYRKTVSETPVAGLVRVDIQVLGAGDQVLASAQTLLKAE